MTKELPILFNGEMVRAILDGRKFQTRRPIKPPKTYPYPDEFNDLAKIAHTSGGWVVELDDWDISINSPFGGVGCNLYVRETCKCLTVGGIRGSDENPEYWWVKYRAGGHATISRPNRKPLSFDKWCPSILAPKCASRITLEVTREWAQRVQDISESDAIAEGIEPKEPDYVVSAWYRYGQLWNSLYAKKGFSFESNPWVFGCEFKVLEVTR